KKYTGQIPGGLKPGQALFFQGVVPSDCHRFSINLKTGPKDHDDIALHFDNRITYVVCNSFRNGKWETESNTNWCPFAKGAAFDVFMVALQYIMVNNIYFLNSLLLESHGTHVLCCSLFVNSILMISYI
uniref:Galectin n=1 Tax=Electrophorus electricus TaxID=8005 RepID=A0AAY5ECV8_ELEEL